MPSAGHAAQRCKPLAAAYPRCPALHSKCRATAIIDFAYRHDSYFIGLTGFSEPDSWLVIDSIGRRLRCFAA
jgi:hypothetical protein